MWREEESNVTIHFYLSWFAKICHACMYVVISLPYCTCGGHTCIRLSYFIALLTFNKNSLPSPYHWQLLVYLFIYLSIYLFVCLSITCLFFNFVFWTFFLIYPYRICWLLSKGFDLQLLSWQYDLQLWLSRSRYCKHLIDNDFKFLFWLGLRLLTNLTIFFNQKKLLYSHILFTRTWYNPFETRLKTTILKECVAFKLHQQVSWPGIDGWWHAAPTVYPHGVSRRPGRPVPYLHIIVLRANAWLQVEDRELKFYDGSRDWWWYLPQAFLVVRVGAGIVGTVYGLDEGVGHQRNTRKAASWCKWCICFRKANLYEHDWIGKRLC